MKAYTNSTSYTKPEIFNNVL